MPIMGMYYYLFENKIGKKVSLKDFPLQYSKRIQGTPLIVVEAVPILDKCFKGLNRGIYGGQWSEYIKRIEKCVQRLNATGIEFVYYFDGFFREFSRHDMKLREDYQISKIVSYFQALREDSDNPVSKYFRSAPPGIVSLCRYLLKYEFNCNVRTSLGDLRQEIASFAANTSNCIGILANDAENLIFETKPLLFARSLKIETMETRLFDRSKLIEVSGLDGELPLLACCVGGNYSLEGQPEMFYKMLGIDCKEKYRYLVRKAVSYIKKRGWRGRDCEMQEIASTLGIKEGNLRDCLFYFKLESLRSTEQQDRFSLLREHFVECRIPTPLYTLLRLKKHKEGISMEDPDDDLLPPSVSIFSCVRRRMYFLLYEGEETLVKEHCVYKNNYSVGETCDVSPLPIEISEEIPSIKELLLEYVEKETCWKLFAACMGITIPISCLKELEPRLVPMCSLLNFLIQDKEIKLEAWEVKAFLYQAIYPRSMDFSCLEIKTSSRPVSLSGIFLRGVITLIKVISVCGYPIPLKEAMPWKYLEGEAFHYAYSTLKNNDSTEDAVRKLCKGDEMIAKRLGEIYRIATMGTRLAEEDGDSKDE